jgi:cation diffusion facilitator family transporter
MTLGTELGVRKTTLAIVASTALGAVKIIAGVLGNSYALIADGVESILDVMSSLVVLGSLKIASSPPTAGFPYGYGKAEPLATMIVASMLLVAALGISIQSVREILTPHYLPAPFTLVVLLGVVATKEVMFRILSRTGESIGSQAMQADAWHHRSDALTSIAAFLGISIALTAGEGYESADDWAALFACTVIGFNGQRLFRSGLREVLDAAPSDETINRIRDISLSVEGVMEIDKCRVRRSGLGLYVDIHVVVDGALSVRQGHIIAHQVKNALLESDLSVLDVTVHIEPSDQSMD